MTRTLLIHNNMKFTSSILITFLCFLLNSCNFDTRKWAEERFDNYLKDQERKTTESVDSVRQLVLNFVKNLPVSYGSNITLIDIIPVDDERNVWCKMYFKANESIDSIKVLNMIDSIIHNNEPFKGWIEYGKYRNNVEFWNYLVSSTNDITRISSIPERNYYRPKRNVETNIFPTQDEIIETNKKLPTKVNEYTLWTKVEYDSIANIESFYYTIIGEIDKSQINAENIAQLKENMVKALLAQTPKRLTEGMTYHYIYQSENNDKLYEIKIHKNDIKN